MPKAAGGSSPARTWLLAACAFGFALVFWNMFATPHYAGVPPEKALGGPVVYTVTSVTPGGPGARAGLRVGDQIVFPRTVEYASYIAGRSYPLRVQRGNRAFYVSVVPVPKPVGVSDWLSRLTNLWFIVFATVVAWFGVGRRARLLSWLMLLWSLPLGRGAFASPWPWLNEAAFLLNGPLSALGIALLATISSTFGRPISPLRRTLEFSTYAAALVGVGAVLVLNELTLLTPWFDKLYPLFTPNFTALLSLGSTIPTSLAAACALVALASVRGEERQRAAWLLTPLAALYIVTALWSIAGGFTGGSFNSGAQDRLAIVGYLATLILVVVLTYAVLHHRLPDVAFVINRAAVFAGVSLVVVGVFVLAEFLFNKFFAVASRTTSIAVSVGIALAIGVSLQYIHRYIDKLVDLLFFRARHEHEQSLRTFAHEAAFVTDADTLLDNAVHEVAVHAEADPVSILVRDERGNYTTARSTNGAIDDISENDRAILKLRAWHAPIELDDVETTLEGSRAYPLISRGELLGILVCGAKRDGQAYAPDESEALSLLARSVGSALDGLRQERRDDLKAAIDDLGHDLRTGMVEIREALRDLNPPMHRAPRFERP